MFDYYTDTEESGSYSNGLFIDDWVEYLEEEGIDAMVQRIEEETIPFDVEIPKVMR